MIYYLKGEIVTKGKDFVVMEVSGVGYKILLPENVIPSLKKKECQLFCYMVIGEKDMRLFGFITEENLKFFESLLKISGIGPQTALKVASIAPMEKLKKGVEEEDEEIIDEILKIGKKKGERVIFEISGKIMKEERDDEAINILKELGFSKKEAQNALRDISKKESVEKRVEKALRNLGNGKR